MILLLILIPKFLFTFQFINLIYIFSNIRLKYQYFCKTCPIYLYATKQDYTILYSVFTKCFVIHFSKDITFTDYFYFNTSTFEVIFLSNFFSVINVYEIIHDEILINVYYRKNPIFTCNYSYIKNKLHKNYSYVIKCELYYERKE